jgi:hypothetical protein
MCRQDYGLPGNAMRGEKETHTVLETLTLRPVYYIWQEITA